jgi:hypothetical protein
VVPAESQLDVDAPLRHREALLIKPGRRGFEDHAGDIRERRPAPQPQRGPELLRRGRLGGRGPGGGDPRVEELGIELTVLDPNPVAGAVAHQDGPAGTAVDELPAQTRHAVLDLSLGAGRRLVVPDRVHERPERDDLVGIEQQNGEDLALALARQVDLRTTDPHLQRPQDPELHRTLLVLLNNCAQRTQRAVEPTLPPDRPSQ